MSTWYWDPTNGDNSNNGSTFANRKKNLSSFTTGPANGDTIRLIQSASAVNQNVNITLTRQSITATLASALTTNIYLDGAWTVGAAANTATTDTVNKKEGANSSSIAIKSNTTGQAAYYATGVLNLSTYTQFSFWIRPSVTIAANQLRIDLCTDTIGAVASTSYTIPFVLGANGWSLITANSGGLLSSAIQSVNLQVLTNISGGATVLIDDIVACPSNFSMSSLIGLNDGFWYPIKSINGTTIIIDMDPTSLQGAGRGWWNPNYNTGTYNLWTKDSTQFVAADTLSTTATQILISGGWDSTSMSTQVGDTFLDAMGQAANLSLGAKANSALDQVGHVRCGAIPIIGLNGGGQNLTNGSVISCTNQAFNLNNSAAVGTTTIRNFKVFGTGGVNASYQVNGMNTILLDSYAISSAAAGVSVTTSIWGTLASGITCANNTTTGAQLGQNSIFAKFQTYDNGGTGIAPGPNSILITATSTANATGGVNLSNTSPNASPTMLFNVMTSANTTAAVVVNANTGGSWVFRNSTFNESTKVSFTANSYGTYVYSEKEGGSATTNKIYRSLGTIQSDSSVIQTAASGISWKFSPTSTLVGSVSPLRCSIGRFSMLANKTLTVTYYAARDSSDITGALRIFGGMYGGVGSPGNDIVTILNPTAAASPTTSDFAQFTISCTPRENCTIEIWGEAYNTTSTNRNLWIDTCSASSS